MDTFTNGILTVPDGTVKGKILVIGILIIFSILLLVRARFQSKAIDKLKAGPVSATEKDQEKEMEMVDEIKEKRKREEEDKEAELRKKFMKKAKKNKYKEIRR